MYPMLISDNPAFWAPIWPLCLALICKLRRSRRIERWGHSFPPSNLQHRTNRSSNCRALMDLRPRAFVGSIHRIHMPWGKNMHNLYHIFSWKALQLAIGKRLRRRSWPFPALGVSTAILILQLRCSVYTLIFCKVMGWMSFPTQVAISWRLPQLILKK